MTKALGLILALWAGEAAADELSLHADRVTIDGERVLGEGQGAIAWGDHRASAESFALDRALGILVMENGEWSHRDGVLQFARAEFLLEEETTVLLDAQGRTVGGPVQLVAERLTASADGNFSGQQVWFTGCRCESPPWAVTANSIEGQVDETADVRGAVLRICDVPILPIPRVVLPLDPRAPRVLLPQFGYGEGGARVSQPVWLPMGTQGDLTVAPEWRGDRGARLTAIAHPDASPQHLSAVTGAFGHDRQQGRSRGLLDVVHGQDDGDIRLGLDSTWVSDPRYLSDHGTNFLARTTPWTEQLAVAGAGPVRIESNTFDARRGVLQRPLAGVLSLPGLSMGPLAASALARTDVYRRGPEGWQGRDTMERIAVAMSLGGGHAFGPLETEAWGEGRYTQWAKSSSRQEARLASAVRLPLWGEVGEVRHLADIGVFGAVASSSGPLVFRVPEDAPAPPWEFGPTLRSRWLSARGVPVRFEGGVTRTPRGWAPMGAGRLQEGPWMFRAQGGHGLHVGTARFEDSRFGIGAGTAHTGKLFQGFGDVGWTLPPPADEWRPGWRGLHDIATGRLVHHGPELTFDSRCQCLNLRASAEFAEDRSVPDVWVHLDLK